MDECIALTASGQQPTLLAMAHQPNNYEAVVAIVALNIAALDSFLHLNNGLSEDELNSVAHHIVDTYGGALSFADLNLVMSNARQGKYGKFYERLSSVDILSWFDQWFNTRLEESAARSVGEHERTLHRIREKQVSMKDVEYQIYKDNLLKAKGE